MGDINSDEFDIICSTSEMGRSLTRKVVVETIDSTWGSPTTSTYTTNAIIGIVIPVRDEDIIELQGRVKTGDAKGLFTEATTMSNDNIIIDTSPTTSTYRVEGLVTLNAGVEEVFQKCILVKIE